MTAESEVIEAASDLAWLLEAGEPSKHQAQRDKDLRGATRKIAKLMRSRFRAQRKAVLDSHALASLHRVIGRVNDAISPESLAEGWVTINGEHVFLGAPASLVAFHGTDAEFDSFSDDKRGSATDEGLLGKGHYFSTDPNIKGKRTHLIKAQVTIHNPLKVSYPKWGANKAELINKALGTHGFTGERLGQALKDRGHDGVILDYSPVGYKHQEIMVPSASQISIKGRESLREDRSNAQPLEDDITALLGTHVYTLPVTARQQQAFADAITTAIDSGGEAAAEMLALASPDTESFVAEYLKDGGFSQLTGDLNQTTVNDLAKAVADAYESGADFDGIVQAVKDSFAQASSYRAQMIAQTELNGAWNQSVMHFGRESGATKKSWIVDLAPCIICIENMAAGVIDMEDDFPSGDDAPGAHPNCYCSLLVYV